DKVLSALPGANCGACGFPGCEGCANAIAKGDAPVTACPVGGATCANKIAEILGVDAGSSEKMVANVLCQGDCDKTKIKYDYKGIESCSFASQISGGPKSCEFGCVGCASCVKACPFDAIEMRNGVAFVLKDKCKACKICVGVCPKKIIEMVPYKSKVFVKCKNTNMGKKVKEACSVGCIGCKICVKNCPKDTIAFENNLAHIVYEGCINCTICAQKCPTKAIHAENLKPKPAAPKVEAPKAEAPKAEAPAKEEAKVAETISKEEN
ncbi:MAG: RnfABCDGE type electron transport complex subunit B, partial [Fenollaria timonensis]